MRYCLYLFVLVSSSTFANNFFESDNKLIEYTGRIDFSNAKKPRFWAAGVYIRAAFTGPSLEILVNDEVAWGKSHNYIEVAIDNRKPVRIKLTEKTNHLMVAARLPSGIHTVTICKNTEALIGYLEFAGLTCESLVAVSGTPSRRIEFFGDSITSGMGNDETSVACDKGDWFDQHNAWLAYGPVTARALNAQWQLTSESGIGLIHNCCNKVLTMPAVYDKVNISKDSMTWDFTRYQPDVVAICLGQNDGVQDSVQFCTVYVNFLQTLRHDYPNAMIVCLNSPMANAPLRTMLKNYLTGIVRYVKTAGDSKFTTYSFSKSWNHGCGGHPDLNDHAAIAEELTAFIRRTMLWN